MHAHPAAQRKRADDDQDSQARWARVWLEADRRQPFKIEQSPPAPRRRWFGILR